MNDEEFKDLLRRQALRRRELEAILNSTREARVNALARGRMGPTPPMGGSPILTFHKQRAHTEIIEADRRKLAALDREQAAEQIEAKKQGKGTENEPNTTQERSIDMTSLEKASIELALSNRATPQPENGPKLEFNRRSELDRD